MAAKRAAALLKGLPSDAKAAIAKNLVGSSLEKFGKVRVFPRGIPFPDEWVISVLPNSPASAKRILDSLTARPGLGRYEVFPYGIINPEIGRIDIGIVPRGR